MTTTRNALYLDKLDPQGLCPGFHLFEVRVQETNEAFILASDFPEALADKLTRLSKNALTLKSAIRLGQNPDVTAWDLLHA